MFLLLLEFSILISSNYLFLSEGTRRGVKETETAKAIRGSRGKTSSRRIRKAGRGANQEGNRRERTGRGKNAPCGGRAQEGKEGQENSSRFCKIFQKLLKHHVVFG